MAQSYVLIAAADLVTARVFVTAAREAGAASTVVREGTVVLGTLLERGAPSLLVVDLGLPGVDAFDLIEGLRRSTPESKTAVVVFSADRDLRDRATELRARLGIGAILARAATDESVRRVVRKLLGVPEETPSRPRAPVPPQGKPTVRPRAARF